MRSKKPSTLRPSTPSLAVALKLPSAPNHGFSAILRAPDSRNATIRSGALYFESLGDRERRLFVLDVALSGLIIPPVGATGGRALDTRDEVAHDLLGDVQAALELVDGLAGCVEDDDEVRGLAVAGDGVREAAAAPRAKTASGAWSGSSIWR